MMEFEIETKYTLDEYRRFNKSVVNVLHKSTMKTIISLVIMIALVAFLLFIEMYKQALFLIIFWVIFIPVITVRLNQNIIKAWKSNTIMQDSINHYKFTEEKLEIRSAMGEQVVEYKDLYRLIETKTNFYIMISSNMGYIISKNDCKEELQQNFIRSLSRYWSK